MIDDTILELTNDIGIGVGAACKAVGRPRATHHRRTSPAHGPPAPPASRKGQRQPRALTAGERTETLQVLRDERFVDQAPASVYATLLDERRYLCSISTMYRLLREQGETGERRRQATHPPKIKPELAATGPNQVYSWDITKLLGPATWTYYYLYVIIDIYSRYVPGWLLADRESSALAEQLLADTCFKQNIGHGQLTVHADRGSSMASKPVALLLADLGVTKTHSRPHVSNDNPYSEAQLKTLKYRPDFPDRFGSLEHARQHCQRFFGWYNAEHRHSGIGLMTPADVHYGRAPKITAARAEVLDAAYAANPERFVRNPPEPPQLAATTWINRPVDDPTDPQQPAQ